MKKYYLKILIICILEFVFITGCSKNMNHEIIGSWKGIIPKQDLTFFKDGRVEMSGYKHSLYRGRYQITNKNQLMCDFPKLSRPINCVITIRGNKMMFIYSSGRTEKYIRKT